MLVRCSSGACQVLVRCSSSSLSGAVQHTAKDCVAVDGRNILQLEFSAPITHGTAPHSLNWPVALQSPFAARPAIAYH